VRKSLIHYPVRPGERIVYALDIKRIGATNFCSAVGAAHSDAGRKVLTVEITIAIVERIALED
jgi:acyl-CoA thioesterase FadM